MPAERTIKLGLPQLREHLSPGRRMALKPLSKAESRRCFQQPNREFDALERRLAGLPSPPPEVES